jgi:hypothetical protein
MLLSACGYVKTFVVTQGAQMLSAAFFHTFARQLITGHRFSLVLCSGLLRNAVERLIEVLDQIVRIFQTRVKAH